MGFLVVFNSICGEDRMSYFWVISEFTFCRTFKISWVSAKFIMSTDLVQCILKMEIFVGRKVFDISFLFKWLLLLSIEIMAPASWMIPMTWFKLIFFCFSDDCSFISILSFLKVFSIYSFVSSVKSTHFKIGVSHGSWFYRYIKWCRLSPVMWVLSLRYRNICFRSYYFENNKLMIFEWFLTYSRVQLWNWFV